MPEINPPLCGRCGGAIPPDALHGQCPRCAFALLDDGSAPAALAGELPALEQVAAAFPQLQILGWLGRGGMGVVCKARQPGLDRLVALKLLPDSLARDAGFAPAMTQKIRTPGTGG